MLSWRRMTAASFWRPNGDGSLAPRLSIALTALAVFATCAASIAQDLKKVPGLWFFSETGDPAPKLGVLEVQGDAHPSFLFADCAKVRNRVQINCGSTSIQRIWLRISAGGKTEDAQVVSMEINEMGPFSWQFIADMGRAALELLTLPSPIHLSLGRKVKRQFEVQETYQLLDQERAEAVSQFVNACFGAR
jgi:hypothetical protein